MFTYHFQSKLIQNEGILGKAAEATFDPALETYYNQLGASCNPSQWAALNFTRLLSNPQYTTYLTDCSVAGLADLLYGKTASNSPTPAIWSLKGANLKKALDQLKPYLPCAPLTTHTQFIKSIATRINASIPGEYIEVLKQSASTPCTLQSRVLMAVMAILNHGLMVLNRPRRDSDGNIASYETSFITRDYDLIKQMAQLGLFSTSQDPTQNQADNLAILERFEKAIFGAPGSPWGSSTAYALEKGSIAAAKITPKLILDSASGGLGTKVCFELVIPKGNSINIFDPAVSILPVTLMRCFTEGIISTIVNNDMVEITSQGLGGEPDFVSRVTATPAVYENAYADCPDKARVTERAYQPIGFGIRTCRLMLLNLESSIYGAKGYVKLNPYEIKAIKPISMSQIDTSAHSLSPVAIYTTFEKSLNGLNYEQLLNVVRRIPALARVLANGNQAISINTVVSALPVVHYSEILKYLITYNPTAISEIKAVGTRTAGNKLPLSGTTLEDKRKTLESMLADNYIAISYLSKEGSREIIATSNEQLLAAKLGNDYKLRYEGWYTQCEVLKSYILASAPTRQAIAEMITNYGIKYLDASKLTGITEPEIDSWIAEASTLRPQRKAPTPNPDNISVRCIPAAPYFRTLKISNIQGVAVLDNI